MCDFRIDKRTIIIVLVIILLMWIARSGTAELLDLLYTLPGILVALTFHEYAHAYAADKLR